MGADARSADVVRTGIPVIPATIVVVWVVVVFDLAVVAAVVVVPVSVVALLPFVQDPVPAVLEGAVGAASVVIVVVPVVTLLVGGHFAVTAAGPAFGHENEALASAVLEADHVDPDPDPRGELGAHVVEVTVVDERQLLRRTHAVRRGRGVRIGAQAARSREGRDKRAASGKIARGRVSREAHIVGVDRVQAREIATWIFDVDRLDHRTGRHMPLVQRDIPEDHQDPFVVFLRRARIPDVSVPYLNREGGLPEIAVVLVVVGDALEGERLGLRGGGQADEDETPDDEPD
jgi:hypothetical protein